jgi:hypothetical protein
MAAWITAGKAALHRAVLPVGLLSLTAGLGLLVSAPQAALASTPATVTPAGPGPIVSGYHKTVCVDDLGDSSANNTPVVTWTCNGSPEQNWTVEADGTIQINGKCLDVHRYGKASKTLVALYTCHGGANQQWQAVAGTLVNPYSGKCLDDPKYNTSDGTQLETFTCNGGRNQQWMLPMASPS